MESSMLIGIVTGLSAAFCQSLCYLSARHYVQRRPDAKGASNELLVLSHVWMGIFSLIILPFCLPNSWNILLAVAQPLVISTIMYLAGQFCLTLSLKHVEASRVSPLLGFKIVVLAAIAAFLPQPHLPGTPDIPIGLTWMQWLAVALCITAAIALSYSGSRLRPRAMFIIAGACIGYSLSDWNITLLVVGTAKFCSPAAAPLLATALSYLFCGLIALLFLPGMGTRNPRAWRDAIPFSILWFLAMIFLFICFGLISTLAGNILQSTRGLISILLGSLFVYWGHHHIEPLHAKGVFIRRLAAGVLMFLAVTLYVIRQPANLQNHWNWDHGHPAAPISPPPAPARSAAENSPRSAPARPAYPHPSPPTLAESSRSPAPAAIPPTPAPAPSAESPGAEKNNTTHADETAP
jgi:drug/metabolite transporter (DMT)-like permease